MKQFSMMMLATVMALSSFSVQAASLSDITDGFSDAGADVGTEAASGRVSGALHNVICIRTKDINNGGRNYTYARGIAYKLGVRPKTSFHGAFYTVDELAKSCIDSLRVSCQYPRNFSPRLIGFNVGGGLANGSYICGKF